MASLYRRGNAFSVTCRIGGKLVRKSVGKNEKTARLRLAETELALQSGRGWLPLSARGKTLPERLEEVLVRTVRDALSLINQTLDEALAEQEGDFDGDSRWSVAWFEQYGFSEGEYGVAETLSKAKNTSLAALARDGFLSSKSGKVRLLRPAELPQDWDPTHDSRLTVWEMVHHLVRVLEAGGESAAAELVAKLGAKAETAREPAYRLYTICERKKRAAEALSYNALVQSWPEISRPPAREARPARHRAIASALDRKQ